jgi:hypothetical protein
MRAPNNVYLRLLAILLLTVGGINAATAQIDQTAYGVNALLNNHGNYNSAFGADALYLNGAGNFNSAFGAVALISNTTGNSNTAIGDAAMYSNTTGSSNSALGDGALDRNTIGNTNTAVGIDARLRILKFGAWSSKLWN